MIIGMWSGYNGSVNKQIGMITAQQKHTYFVLVCVYFLNSTRMVPKEGMCLPDFTAIAMRGCTSTSTRKPTAFPGWIDPDPHQRCGWFRLSTISIGHLFGSRHRRSGFLATNIARTDVYLSLSCQIDGLLYPSGLERKECNTGLLQSNYRQMIATKGVY